MANLKIYNTREIAISRLLKADIPREFVANYIQPLGNGKVGCNLERALADKTAGEFETPDTRIVTPRLIARGLIKKGWSDYKIMKFLQLRFDARMIDRMKANNDKFLAYWRRELREEDLIPDCLDANPWFLPDEYVTKEFE